MKDSNAHFSSISSWDVTFTPQNTHIVGIVSPNPGLVLVSKLAE